MCVFYSYSSSRYSHFHHNLFALFSSFIAACVLECYVHEFAYRVSKLVEIEVERLRALQSVKLMQMWNMKNWYGIVVEFISDKADKKRNNIALQECFGGIMLILDGLQVEQSVIKIQHDSSQQQKKEGNEREAVIHKVSA